MADIPPPHMVAPWVYQPASTAPPVNNAYYYNYPQGSAYAGGTGAMPYVPNTPSAPIQNNFYNTNNPGNYWYNNQQAAPYGYPPYAQQGQQTQQPSNQPNNQQVPPQQQPPVNNQQPPQNNNQNNTPDNTQANTPAPAEQAQNPPSDILSGSLSPDVIEDLNNRLNNSSDSIRADAAMDLFKILEGNPQLANQAEYKDYVNAFMEKILKDPSPMVRQGALLAMELGYVTNMSPNVNTLLEGLTKKGGLVNIESDTAQNILSGLNNPGNHSLNDHNPAFQANDSTGQGAQASPDDTNGQLITAGVNPSPAAGTVNAQPTQATPTATSTATVPNTTTPASAPTAAMPPAPVAPPVAPSPTAGMVNTQQAQPSTSAQNLSPHTQQQLADVPTGDQLQQMIQGLTAR